MQLNRWLDAWHTERLRLQISSYPLQMRYFRYHWQETRGDANDGWGTSWWYIEVADDGYAERQIERYACGVELTYDRVHLEDPYGGLAEKTIGPEDWPELEPIAASEFNALWLAAQPLNRRSG